VSERLYHADPYRTHFFSPVLERLTWEGKPAVVLERTAFYPTSGGQPADRGTLDGVEVLDVLVREQDGDILHVLSEAPSYVSEHGRPEAEGMVDWVRRFDHMQQHTGQHILSAAFEQLLSANTVGFHLGTELSTVDIDVAHLESRAVQAVEELANQVIWENRPVHTRFISADELASLPLRRPPAVEGPIRIVEIAGPATDSGHSFDVNPCGGTHVARTGEVGLVKVVRLDYRGDETRVEFLCGGRALSDYQAKNTTVNRLTGLLTVGHWELDQAVERLQSEAKRLRHDLRRVQNHLVQAEVRELAATAQPVPPSGGKSYRVVWKIWEGRDPGEMRALAQQLAQRPAMVALLSSIGERTHLCFARAEEVDLDAAALLREACAQLGGKGGGRPNMAQGSAPAADTAKVRTLLAELMSSLGLYVS
jgi:alanyl-tRNA synthetase